MPRLTWLERAESTNTELVRFATGAQAADWPAWSVLATDVQTSGRGRLGRTWSAPPGASLAISVLLRPTLPRAEWGWLSLVAGAAMTRALRAQGAPTRLKWPNDVLVHERKICGVLAEVLPDGSGVVIGAGVNTAMAEADLPVPTATSLSLLGIEASPDDVLAGYLGALRDLVARLDRAGSAEAAGVAAEVTAELATIGRGVRVHLPGGEVVTGVATRLDHDGRLEVERRDGRIVQVAAGDVEHLRYE